MLFTMVLMATCFTFYFLALYSELSKNGSSCNGTTESNGPRRRRDPSQSRETPEAEDGGDYTPEQATQVKK